MIRKITHKETQNTGTQTQPHKPYTRQQPEFTTVSYSSPETATTTNTTKLPPTPQPQPTTTTTRHQHRHPHQQPHPHHPHHCHHQRHHRHHHHHHRRRQATWSVRTHAARRAAHARTHAALTDLVMALAGRVHSRMVSAGARPNDLVLKACARVGVGERLRAQSVDPAAHTTKVTKRGSRTQAPHLTAALQRRPSLSSPRATFCPRRASPPTRIQRGRAAEEEGGLPATSRITSRKAISEIRQKSCGNPFLNIA